MTLGVTMWRRSIHVSSLAAYAADPAAFCRAAAASGRGPVRAIALGALGIALVAGVAGALALSGRAPLAGLLDEAPLDALLSLVRAS